MHLVLSLIIIIAGSSNAAWLKWTTNTEHTWRPAQETGGLSPDPTGGWTPRPTPAPGVVSEGEAVLELLRRDDFTTTNWTNAQTCGWIAGSSSAPWTCGKSFSCATNSDHAVQCVSEEYQPFYVSCLDFQASQAGSCNNLNPNTGCCQDSANPACITYLWTGSPVRSQFRCGVKTAVTTIFDEPQFVIDASISASRSSESAARASSESAARASSLASEASKASASRASNSELSSGASADPLLTPTDPAITTTPNNNPTNIGGIVGGVIGGLLFLLLLLLLLFCCCRRRNKSKKNTYNLSYKNKHNNNEKTNIYRSRREQRAEQRKNQSRGTTWSGRSKSRGRDDEAIPHDERPIYVANHMPEAPREAYLPHAGTTVYAPQYHFHMGGKNSRDSSLDRSGGRPF